MIIYLMRHGQTEYNKVRLIQGRTNVPLNEIGRMQALTAKEVVNELNVEVVYSGNRIRQIETAKLATNNIKHIILDNFNEISFGEFEQTNVDVAFSIINYRLHSNIKGFGKETGKVICDAFYNADTTKTAENYKMMSKRAIEGFNKVVEESKRNNINRVLIVSSGMTIGAIIQNLCPDFDKYKLENCSIYSLSIEKDGSIKANTVFKGVKA